MRTWVSALVVAAVIAPAAPAAGDPETLSGLRDALVAVLVETHPRPRTRANRRLRTAATLALREIDRPVRHLGGEIRVATAAVARLERDLGARALTDGSPLALAVAQTRASLAASVGQGTDAVGTIGDTETDIAVHDAIRADLYVAARTLARAAARSSPLRALQSIGRADARNVAAARRLTAWGSTTFQTVNGYPPCSAASHGSTNGSLGSQGMTIQWGGPGCYGIADMNQLLFRAGDASLGTHAGRATYLDLTAHTASRWANDAADVTVTFHDPRLRLVAGTFEFVLKRDDDVAGPSLDFREGSFLVRYTTSGE